jgi:hypothetical protein
MCILVLFVENKFKERCKWQNKSSHSWQTIDFGGNNLMQDVFESNKEIN